MNKFRLIYAFAVAAICFAPLACAPQANSAPSPAATTPAAELTVTESDSGKTLKLGGNATVAISLASNVTTGFSWSVTKIDGDALAQIGDIQYAADPAPPRVVGAGGTAVVRFRAVKPGQSTITLGYARPWEQGTPPIRTFAVTLIVEKAP